uniref:Mid2 domain-containing protein n=1 Tax=Panagrellus redivivus TaxID=6233 RepID=A0A7E4W2C1_PANRE
MQPIFKFLAFVAVICVGRAEVKLTQGMNTTVTFDGEELDIRLDNPQRQKGELKLCFKSTSDAYPGGCPEGYAAVHPFITKTVHTFQLSRQGLFLEMGAKQSMSAKVVFESNGQLNLMLVAISNSMTVTLTNADIPVVTTTTLASVKKQTNSKAMVGIIGVAVVFILLFFIISAIVLYFCWYRKRSNRLTQTTGSEVHQPLEKVRKPAKPLPQVAARSYVPPPPKRQPLMPSTTTSTTRASEDKPQLVVATKTAPNASVALDTSCVSLVPAVTPDAVSRQKSRKSKASRKSKRHVSTISKTMQTEKATEPLNMNPKHGKDPASSSFAESPRFEKRSLKWHSKVPVSESTRSK